MSQQNNPFSGRSFHMPDEIALAQAQAQAHAHAQLGLGDSPTTTEIVRRPRGRPPGSKNKPKVSDLVAREPSDAGMCSYILEVPVGNDIVEAVMSFVRRKNVGICILAGSGAVSDVTLRQPFAAQVGATVTFHGQFEILSTSATFLPQGELPVFSMSESFTVSVAGPQGQIVGGIVAGSLVAATTVFIIAATFSNPTYHRLPDDREEGRDVENHSVGGMAPAPTSKENGSSRLFPQLTGSSASRPHPHPLHF